MSVPKRFIMLSSIGSLMKVLAWIALVVSVIVAIGVALAGGVLGPIFQSLFPGSSRLFATGGGVIAALLTLIIGLFYFLVFYAIGELLHLMVAVEENTRLSAALLLRMHQESQSTAQTDYGPGGFASEPFEG